MLCKENTPCANILWHIWAFENLWLVVRTEGQKEQSEKRTQDRASGKQHLMPE